LKLEFIESIMYLYISDLNTLLTIKEGLHDESLTWTDIQADVDELSTSENIWIAEEAASLYSLLTGIKILEPVNAPQVHLSNRMHLSEPEEDEFKYFTVYPNPANNFCVVELSKDVSLTKKSEFVLLDPLGKVIKRIAYSSDIQQVIDLSNIPTGVYNLVLMDLDEIISKVNLVIKK